MNEYIMSFGLMLLFCAFGHAQNTLEIKIFTEKDQEPLLGATVYIPSLDKGATTNFDGIAMLDEIPNGTYQVQISYLGFKTLVTSISVPVDTELTFYMEESANALDEVVLQSTRSTRTIKKIPTRIEFIGVEELGEKAIMNPTNISMVLRESTGIQMQQTSLSSANTNIRIQGLDGRYTQLLRDGFPLYGGFSSGLSILQIPPLDLRQFEIIKGSSSTLYGGGAIAGLVNMVSKTPDEDPQLDIMLTQTQALGSTVNVFYGDRKNKWGWTLYGSGHYQKAFDPENDGFSNLPHTQSISFNPKLFYYPSENTTVWFGINGTYDDRIGGDITKIEEGENGIHQYTEENLSKRLSTQAVYESQLDSEQSISIKNSIAFFDRSLEIPDLSFKGSQWNTFTEASYQKQGLKADWVLGANLYTTSFDERDNPLERDQDDLTVGLFVNNIHDLSEHWILETGLRTDYATDWGFFALPRVSMLFKSNGSFSSRLGGGLGYKIPDIFTEEAEFINFRNIRPIDKSNLEAERSYGLNLDFNYQTRLLDNVSFSINQLFYLTAIRDGLLLTPVDDEFFEFENASGEILSRGAETNIKFTYKDFRWFLNYALIDTRLNYLPGNPQKPLTAKHNAGSVLMYESEKWRIGYETYYTGKQLLSNGLETSDFITMGLLAMRNFKWGSAFVNFENFTDRRQSRFTPLVLPPHENPTFPEIYAPTDGFIFSVGIILKPFGNEDND
ncbi:iron complex outermembrane recepter protein [Robiginitalea myxolifaciens]|uniref:Iron complex outermembrane recepter protein n=1 Tax=Robiginitalea myxolifaciens TaxID=400055 RepID=A0A1I6FVW2_9FLAO|nr:TonB-dependent receptor [Robiginitalea myxolifaciens]SFR33957.1 iron complex outermembrane recepter protein [Robiginitalea myxolifaciens]